MLNILGAQLRKVRIVTGDDAKSSAAAVAASSVDEGAATVQLVAEGSKSNLPVMRDEAKAVLQKLGVPLIDCHACPNPCTENEEHSSLHAVDPSFLRTWSKQEVDFESELLGTTSPFLRHVLVSTGQRDWPKHIAEVSGSLAQLLSNLAAGETETTDDAEESVPPKGCWGTAPAAAARQGLGKRPTKITVSNSSHHSQSDELHLESLFVFPDWLCISNVPSLRDAPEQEAIKRSETVKTTYRRWLSPTEPRDDLPEPAARTMCSVLPYSAVILLCSHKKRDVRCHIAAPVLAEAFKSLAEQDGWHVDERGDDCLLTRPPPQQDGTWSGHVQQQKRDKDGLQAERGFGFVEPGVSIEEQERQVTAWRKRAASPSDEKHLGIFYCSHIGGHRYAGNVIIYFPNGAGVWYGRVSPDPAKGDVAKVWRETVVGGKVIQEFLRAGINLVRSTPSKAGQQHFRPINDW
ncbi:hypothetical protein K437DRAFT_258491 [Tilletiaria anomala UBC 951]|uniref:Sucraseferredoxin-like protein n=1 Tax=Tilletiaria anomala (strain ATCC 24038 / CBS 436.72 / UBC 951) TaxID=1037660 RepID=A0A066VKR8_TILAU|nr:uncharacterized protein K437DRAFT_258491 [Tilletiaria anomala UBC 951]KDN40873.1 hypothetical protein K437DRAFT_258491 [Tilletiaria anomala UBC 951]